MSALPAASRHEHTVAVTRVYDAPVGRVFEAWTRATHLQHWFAPRGFTVHSCVAEPRPGGVFRLCMRSPQGEDYWVRGEYLVVEPPQRLVVHCFADDAAGVQRLEETISVAFAPDGSRTRLALKAVATGDGAVAASMLRGMDQGWSETLDRLGERSRAA